MSDTSYPTFDEMNPRDWIVGEPKKDAKGNSYAFINRANQDRRPIIFQLNKPGSPSRCPFGSRPPVQDMMDSDARDVTIAASDPELCTFFTNMTSHIMQETMKHADAFYKKATVTEAEVNMCFSGPMKPSGNPKYPEPLIRVKAYTGKVKVEKLVGGEIVPATSDDITRNSEVFMAVQINRVWAINGRVGVTLEAKHVLMTKGEVGPSKFLMADGEARGAEHYSEFADIDVKGLRFSDLEKDASTGASSAYINNESGKAMAAFQLHTGAGSVRCPFGAAIPGMGNDVKPDTGKREINISADDADLRDLFAGMDAHFIDIAVEKSALYFKRPLNKTAVSVKYAGPMKEATQEGRSPLIKVKAHPGVTVERLNEAGDGLLPATIDDVTRGTCIKIAVKLGKMWLINSNMYVTLNASHIVIVSSDSQTTGGPSAFNLGKLQPSDDGPPRARIRTE